VLLNPTSMPFLPGGILANSSLSEDDAGPSVQSGHGTPTSGAPSLGFRVPNLRPKDDRSSLSMSPSEYRSIRSSPSLSSLDDRDRDHREYDPRESVRLRMSPSPAAGARGSPAFRQADTERVAFPAMDSSASRVWEPSMFGSLETLP
jgi:translation initiation factor 4A